MILLSPAFARTAQGCDVPVFRYAIKNWQPTEFRLLVYVDKLPPSLAEKEKADAPAEAATDAEDATEPAEPAESTDTTEPTESPAAAETPEAEVSEMPEDVAELERLIGRLKESLTSPYDDPMRDMVIMGDDPMDQAPPARMNITYQVVAISDVAEDAPIRSFWEELEDATTPHMVLVEPSYGYQARTVWDAPLTDKSIDLLLDSPLRKRIAKRLTAGDIGIWVLMECDDKEKNEAAAKLLQKHIDEFNKQFKGFTEPLVFSLDRLPKDAAEEAVIRSQLMTSEPDLGEYKDEPMAFCIFARGRVLYGLIGKGINDDQIFRVLSMMVGPCLCTDKQASEGFDLVIHEAWDKAAIDMPEISAAELMQYASQVDEGPIEDPNAELREAAAIENQPSMGLGSLVDAVGKPGDEPAVQPGDEPTEDPSEGGEVDPAEASATTTDVANPATEPLTAVSEPPATPAPPPASETPAEPAETVGPMTNETPLPASGEAPTESPGLGIGVILLLTIGGVIVFILIVSVVIASSGREKD